ncbi:MAG: type II secretion system protein GspG [Planctomycetota bacterium]|nr:MAG: type II secretion system protein GspG [Planctomycetota bacterium]
MVQSDRLRLFGPRSVARGWKADEELEVALGLVPPSPEQALALDRRAARADLDRIAEAVARFRSDVGFHPLRLSQLWEPPAKVRGWKGPYLEGPLYDPWGSGYAYRPGRRSFFLCSYGADGAPGGQGADADVVREESLQK